MKQTKSRTPLNRIWFLTRGYRKHPRHNLWAHEGCSYFVSAYGTKLANHYTPAMRAKQKGRGYTAPRMRHFENRLCHILMGEIFYGERPIYINSKGETYFGVCHHLIEDLLNFCPENLLCWLTYSEHRKADNRRRALEALVPDASLYVFSYARLRELQDPNNLTDDEFQAELEETRLRLKAIRSKLPNGNLSPFQDGRYLFPPDLLSELLDPCIVPDSAFTRTLDFVLPAPPGTVLPDCTPEPLRDV